MPLLDTVGVYNASIKANVMREGPLDGALMAQVYTVPVVNNLVRTWDERLDLGLFGESDDGEDLVTAKLGYIGVGAMTSVQVLKPWSIHAGAYYGRVAASGTFDLADLPDVVVPGLNETISFEDGTDLTGKVAGEMIILNLASDFRFNRRDSVVLQYRSVLYGRATAGIGADAGDTITVEGVPAEMAVNVSYGALIPQRYSYSISGAWQFQWKHWQARVGAGWSYVPFAWVIQPLELSYRFGGKTRHEEAMIRAGFRDNLRDLRDGADVPDAPKPPAPPTPPPTPPPQ
jgi:hypothetical protein